MGHALDEWYGSSMKANNNFLSHFIHSLSAVAPDNIQKHTHTQILGIVCLCERGGKGEQKHTNIHRNQNLRR